LESLMVAVDAALNAATPAFAEQPPVFKHRYRLLDNERKKGKESEISVSLSIATKVGIGLIGTTRDENLLADTPYSLKDEAPFSTAVGFFRHEDADYRLSLYHILPVLNGKHRIRVRGYSFGWDGQQVVPTERHGALGLGIYATNEHFGTVDLPPNKAEDREFTAWLERGKGLQHGTDDWLRLIGASLENFRDYAHGKNAGVPGPMSPAPGVAIEWVELEGPIHEVWPPASQTALFGNLPVKPWTAESGMPKPRQQLWLPGHWETLPTDIYGHRNEKQPTVHVVAQDVPKDASRLLSAFMPRAFRRAVADVEVAELADQVTRQVEQGTAFQDAMLAAYRQILTSPDFFLVKEKPGPLQAEALAGRLARFLWSTTPDDELKQKAATDLQKQVDRLLDDPRGQRFIDDFLGQWLQIKKIGDTQPDKTLYPEFKPWLQEAAVLEARAYFRELLKEDLPITYLIDSPFLMINEPLAELYGISGVRGWEIRKVANPPESLRGGFLTQAAVLKTTAAGTTTSPVKRGVFVLEKLLGIHPTPPPPNVGAIEPDVRGATTIREQLDKHRADAACAGCHRKMDGYGFALESFDVVGAKREQYRAVGGKGDHKKRKYVDGHPINYHDGPGIDPSGQMPDGRPFANVQELRKMLAADPAALAQAFLSQLAVYATGAEISLADRAELDRIVRATAAKQYGFRSLLHGLVASRLFREG
jgi:hypothetical protein